MPRRFPAPIRTALYDDQGRITRPWREFFEGIPEKEDITAAAESTPGSTGTPAPNIATATCTLTLMPWANVSVPVFGGTIDLPTADANYEHLNTISVLALSPSGKAYEIARYQAPFSSGGTLDYSGWDSDIRQGSIQQAGWSVQFVCLNELGSPTADPCTIAGLTIPATSVTAVAAVDASTLDPADPDYMPRWKDPARALHTVLKVAVITPAGQTLPITVWTDRGDGVKHWHGWFTIAGSGKITLGAEGSNTIVYPPVAADENWTVTCAAGAVESESDVPAGAVTSASFLVPAPPAPSATAATGAYVDAITYAQVQGGAYTFGWPHLYVTLPLDDPNFWYARLKVQTGSLVGGVFTPGGKHPVETAIADWENDDHHGENMVRVPGTNTIYDANPNWWDVPSDANSCHRLKWYVASRLNSGTETLQSCWSSGVGVSTPGTAAFQDVIADTSKAQVLGLPPAPNVTAATCALTYAPWANVSVPVFGGVITLPTADPNYAHLKTIVVSAVSPAGHSFEIANLPAPYTGGTLNYSGWNSSVQQTAAAQAGWSVRFDCYNEDYSLSATPYTITGITIAATAISTVVGFDASALATNDPNYVPRWKDSSEALHVVLKVNITVPAGQTMPVTVWLTKADGIHLWQGWQTIAGAGVIVLGAQGSNTIVYPPINADENWTVTCAAGAYESWQAPPTGAVTSAAFLVKAPAAPASTAASSGNIGTITYTVAGAGYAWGWDWLRVTLPYSDPEFWYGRFSIQKTDVNGNAAPDYEGVERVFTDDQGSFCSVANGVVTITNPNQWTVPPKTLSDGSANPYVYFTFRVRVGSRRAGGTETLQAVWWNGSAYTGQYLRIQVDSGLAVAAIGSGSGTYITNDPATGLPRLNSNNIGSSVLADWDFENSPVGSRTLTSPTTGSDAVNTWRMVPFGPVGARVLFEIKNDGGFTGSKYLRMQALTAYTSPFISQTINAQSGLAFYVTCFVRCNVPVGPWDNYFQIIYSCLASNGAELAQGGKTISAVNGGWRQVLGCTFVTPANTAKVEIMFATANPVSDTVGYWDVDCCILQPVTNQENAGVTNKQSMQSLGGDYPAMVTDNAAGDSGIFAKTYIQLYQASNGATIYFTLNGGPQFLVLAATGGAYFAGFPTGMVMRDALGTVRTGYTGPVSGRNCIGGMVY